MSWTWRDCLMLRPFVLVALLLTACEPEPTPAESARRQAEEVRETIDEVRQTTSMVDALGDPSDPEFQRGRREMSEGLKQLEELERVFLEVEAKELAAAAAAS